MKEQTFRTSIGGQAILEGIMMRGPKKDAIAVRLEDGSIKTRVQPRKSIKDAHPAAGWPLVRGAVNFIDSMVTGVQAITYSAEQFPAEEEEPGKLEKKLEEKLGSEKFGKLTVAVAVVLGIALAVGLFILLPTFLVSLLDRWITHPLLRNLLEGIVRIVIFLVYIRAASGMKEIKRVWQYHGAEHKTIHCYEQGLELTVENCRDQKRAHPRCGTSFLFLVMIISILVFAVVQWSNRWIRMAMRLVLLPIVVGISYELIKLAGRYDNVFTRILSAPGMWLQKLTTAEPDDSMLEVAITSLKLVLPDERGTDTW